MIKENLMAYNLQFFAEGEADTGANETEAADLSEETVDDSTEDEAEAEDIGETEEAAAPQSAEENHRYAAARREAESQYKSLQQAQADLDAQFASVFGNYENPVTHQPIKSAREYFEAFQAQQKLETQQKLRDAGVDPDILDKAIANSPVVQEAQRIQAQMQAQQVEQMVQEDFAKVMKLDPTMQSAEDIVNDASYSEVVAFTQTHPGVRFADAYKLVNFDKLAKMSREAAQQGTINQIKGKGHLKTQTSAVGSDNDADIPASEMEHWKAMFPDKDAKGLRALYNKVHKK